jgi:septum site-determining protein MinC
LFGESQVSDRVFEGELGNKANLDPLAFSATASNSSAVTARGTEDGLVLRIDGNASWTDILSDLEAFLGGRKKFFQGGEVSVEWLERLPSKEQCDELESLLNNHYGMSIAHRKRKPVLKKAENTKSLSTSRASAEITTSEQFSYHKSESQKSKLKGENILDEIEKLASGGEPELSEAALSRVFSETFVEDLVDSPGSRMQVKRVLGEEIFVEEDANSKLVFGTVRSGQKIETPFSLVVVGDVNPGADLIAGGDILVLGNLRGTAHASAYDDDSFDRVIIAMQMQPMQLRIGSIISRGSEVRVKGAEIARIENRRIVVESYNPRGSLGKK